MKKHIIIVDLFEFGGINSHLKTLIKYFGKSNVILVLKNKDQLSYLKNIDGAEGIQVTINSGLYPYAHLSYRFTTNIKELLQIIRSIIAIHCLSIKNGFADISISSVDPEKYLYLLWIPFAKVVYILHSTPDKRYSWFTTFTCNFTLGKRKKIITVSIANKNLICENWLISDRKKGLVDVIYNCVLGSELKYTAHKESDQLTILTMGHVIEYKNPALWLEVAKQVTSRYCHVHFLWLGNGPLWDEFKVATEDCDRIFFKGAVTDPARYLKEAAVYYQPSLSETQGIAVVEAMYYYLPCVVSDTGGLPETVVHEYNGIVVNPTIIKDHVSAISTLLDNPARRVEYGLNSHQRVLDFYSFETFKAKMDALYFA
ncbi:glycosyltransferase family 4 protein [Mucilaginibacter sp.]